MKTKLEVLQMEKRQSGYYWVKLPGNPPEWEIGKYFDRTDEWYLCGLRVWHSDEDFLEINEQQIKQ